MSTKVLHIINSSGLGGAESVVLGILKKSDYKCFCLRKETTQRFPEDRVEFGTNSLHYKYNPIVFYRLWQIVKKNKIKILHVHLANSLPYALAIKFFNPKIVVIYHEHGEIQYNKSVSKFIHFTHRWIDLFIAVSESISSQLIKNGVKEKSIILLRNFVDTDKYKQLSSEKSREIKYVFGFAGRIVTLKGWKEYLGAVKRITQNNHSFKFVIAGDGVEREEMLQEISTFDSSIDIEYKGYLTNMNDFYNSIDCFVLPSHFEASPLSLIEAQACGVVVIASDIPSIKEIISNKINGFLFKKGKENDLACVMLEVYKNKKLRDAMVSTASQDVQKFALHTYMVTLQNIYDKY